MNKKILHLSRTMGQGGAEKVVFQLCKNINAKHYVASCGGIYVNELKNIGVSHYYIPDMDCKNILNMLKTFFILFKIIKIGKIEIIHTHHRMAAFYARILQFLFPQLSHIYTAHNVFKGKCQLLRFALSKAKVVACGVTVKKNLENEYGINDVILIYNSVESYEITDDKNLLINENATKGNYLIGTIGRITKQKGMDVFVRAIAKTVQIDKRIVGVIIGDGEDRMEIENLVSELNIDENIIFLGFQKNVHALINEMQFIVLASRWEGFPLTPIETFSMGKSIIVSDIPNNLEIVEPYINGLAFKKDNAEDLAEKIQYMIKKKAKYEKAAKMKYEKLFSYDTFIKNYSKQYEML